MTHLVTYLHFCSVEKFTSERFTYLQNRQQQQENTAAINTEKQRWLHLFDHIARTIPSQDHSSAVSGHQLSPAGLAMPTRSTKMNLALNDRARPPAAQHRFNLAWKWV